MLSRELSKLHTADGSIQGIESSTGSLIVHFLDCKETEWIISFKDVIAFQSIGAENEDLAAVEIVDKDDFLEQVKSADSEEDLNDMQCALFRSAWSNTPLLKVIASSCEVSKKENGA